MTMNRRTFSAALVAGAATSLISERGMAVNSVPVVARNVVLVHGLFADGSCWSDVIARLQPRVRQHGVRPIMGPITIWRPSPDRFWTVLRSHTARPGPAGHPATSSRPGS